MSTAMPDNRLVVEDVELWPTSVPGEWVYLPRGAGPQRQPDGAPSLTLVVAPGGGTVSLGAVLGASESQLVALRTAVATRDALPAAAVRLVPAPLRVVTVELELADAGGARAVLARSSSSGFPPYSAVLSAQLDAVQATQVAAAVQGAADTLLVRYRCVLGRHDETVLVRTTDIASWFAGTTGAGHIVLMPGATD